MTADLRIFRDTYVDSVVQLSATRAMSEVDRGRVGGGGDGHSGEPRRR